MTRVIHDPQPAETALERFLKQQAHINHIISNPYPGYDVISKTIAQLDAPNRALVDFGINSTFPMNNWYQTEFQTTKHHLINQANIEVMWMAATRLTKNLEFIYKDQLENIFTDIFKTPSEYLNRLLANQDEYFQSQLPPNLSPIQNITFSNVYNISMSDGLPLYGLPRPSIASALIFASNLESRRLIIGNKWREILADCRRSLSRGRQNSTTRFAWAATSLLDTIDSGYFASAQALASSLIDALTKEVFGSDIKSFKPSKSVLQPDAYDELELKELIAFSPIWSAYQQFFPSMGDKVPRRFNRHATAHTVDRRQFNRINAIQAAMIACSLLHWISDHCND